ncbi:MAG: hypothetical protein M3414_08655 [Pseudomonadota bacterium]|nr:hypothetical protein [Pseudomonadota bacterium]
MPTKLTSKSQLTLPKAASAAVRAKLAKLDMSDADINGAVEWARQRMSERTAEDADKRNPDRHAIAKRAAPKPLAPTSPGKPGKHNVKT